MNKSQDYCLRNEAWTTQWHDDIRIGMHQKILKLSSVLSLKNPKINFVPFVRLDGWSCLFLRRLRGRRLRDSGRV